jgi:hypothetical protein
MMKRKGRTRRKIVCRKRVELKSKRENKEQKQNKMIKDQTGRIEERRQSLRKENKLVRSLS